MPKYINNRGKIRELNMEPKKALDYGWTPYYVPEQDEVDEAINEILDKEPVIVNSVFKTEEIQSETTEPQPKKTRKPRTKKK